MRFGLLYLAPPRWAATLGQFALQMLSFELSRISLRVYTHILCESLRILIRSRQPLTFPGRLQPSIISRLRLNRRVRHGYGCFPQAHHHRKFLIFFMILQNQTVDILNHCLHRKEVIQPHLPIRLPCYDFTPVTGFTFDCSSIAVGSQASGASDSHGVTGGVYKARERIHRDILIRDY